MMMHLMYEEPKDYPSLIYYYFNLEGNSLGVEATKAISDALKKHNEFKKALWKDLFTGRLKEEIPKSWASSLMAVDKANIDKIKNLEERINQIVILSRIITNELKKTKEKNRVLSRMVRNIPNTDTIDKFELLSVRIFFIPTFLVGAAWGKFVVLLLNLIIIIPSAEFLNPEKYVLFIGAAANLGGVIVVLRMTTTTISLSVVILFETTTGIDTSFIFPLIITLMIATKWIGDYYTEHINWLHLFHIWVHHHHLKWVGHYVMGLGGGFVATIYKRSSRKVETLIAREDENMFVDRPVEGGAAIAVPGEIKGYWELHKKYGVLPWRNLVKPSIDLCRNGYRVSKYLAKSLENKKNKIMSTILMKEIFVNPKTGRVWNEGDIMTRPLLADTLEIISEQGEDAIYYNGSIGQKLIQDIKSFNGIITEDDLMEYKIKWWWLPEQYKIGDNTLYTTSLPTSGVILGLIMNILDGFIDKTTPTLWHRVIESFKYDGYGMRTHLGDLEFVPGLEDLIIELRKKEFAEKIRKRINDTKTFTSFEYYGANFSDIKKKDHGTANVLAVLAPNGDAITVTSTINNSIFEAVLRSRQTGIILNDQMDDFSTPGKPNGFGLFPSPANFIKPRKRPLSSMCPSIIIDRNGDDVRLLIGGAGRSKITTSVALTLIRHLYFEEDLFNAIQSPRIHHHQLAAPMLIEYEEYFDQGIIKELKTIWHSVIEKHHQRAEGFAAITGIIIIHCLPSVLMTMFFLYLIGGEMEVVRFCKTSRYINFVENSVNY